MKEDCRVKKLTFHPPDSWIIADYKAYGINKVYSGNKHFVDACNLFGIDASQTPSFDRSISDKFKELFKSGRK